MFRSSKKSVLILFVSILITSAMHAATNQQYDTGIAAYNQAFNVAFSLWQTVPTARPLNWEDSFIDTVKQARRLFTTIKLYWEHDKRTLPNRSRASVRLLTLMPIPGLPKATDAVMLLNQHEKILAQLEAEAERLAQGRIIIHRTLTSIKTLLTTGLVNIANTVGLAQNSINTLGQTPAIAQDPNYKQAMAHLNQTQIEITQLIQQVAKL